MLGMYSMNLYIRIVDGQITDHPILESNLLQAYPGIDLNNSQEYVKFTRIPKDVSEGTYEIAYYTYEWDGDTVRDAWHTRPMTTAERLAKQETTKQDWQTYGYPSWQFNETTCSFEAPVPHPNDGNKYRWSEATLSWELFTP